LDGTNELRPITQGDWVVRSVDRIDEASDEIWFQASGREPNRDPYLRHHYRVKLDGSELVSLTPGDGDHTLQSSPSRAFYIDSYSRVDAPPTHELRRAVDGSLIQTIATTEIDSSSSDTPQPEVFAAPGRDGETEIWGILFRPKDWKPTKRYPVIEAIYAGPHDSHVPKSFQSVLPHRALTDLGFVVVQIDGMGTANRSKAFHDVCWQNLRDAGFPDRIAWMRAAAKSRPYMDLDRVGIFGTSAGGQNAAGAVIFHSDFYRAAAAFCGCHDNRLDKASWNEQWMGYPVGSQYSDSSNIDHASQLKGRLFLMVGAKDTNVPPESTLKFSDALVRAGKDFELLVMPDHGHGDGGAYGQRRMRDFFVESLQGIVTPNHNENSDTSTP
jgi:dipeptidyl aminopeptidase/acylaminoacyl peptidase